MKKLFWSCLLTHLFSSLVFSSLSSCLSLVSLFLCFLSPSFSVSLCLCLRVMLCVLYVGVHVVSVVWHSEKPRVSVQNVPRVYRHHAHMINTCGRGARTHGDVLNEHTEGVLNKHTRRGWSVTHQHQHQHTHQQTHQHTHTLHHCVCWVSMVETNLMFSSDLL